MLATGLGGVFWRFGMCQTPWQLQSGFAGGVPGILNPATWL
jgi:hypothetical protein